MLYPVRVLDSDGNIKKVLTSSEIKEIFWQQFEKEEELKGNFSSRQKKLSPGAKKMLDAQFPGISGLSYSNN
jgi:hypothetical protein